MESHYMFNRISMQEDILAFLQNSVYGIFSGIRESQAFKTIWFLPFGQMDDFPDRSVSLVESDHCCTSLTSQGSAWKEGRHHSSPCRVFEEELKGKKLKKN